MDLLHGSRSNVELAPLAEYFSDQKDRRAQFVFVLKIKIKKTFPFCSGWDFSSHWAYLRTPPYHITDVPFSDLKSHTSQYVSFHSSIFISAILSTGSSSNCLSIHPSIHQSIHPLVSRLRFATVGDGPNKPLLHCPSTERGDQCSLFFCEDLGHRLAAHQSNYQGETWKICSLTFHPCIWRATCFRSDDSGACWWAFLCVALHV